MVQLTERPGTKKIANSQDKFIYEVGVMYDAENRFLEAQQMIWQCCQNNQLKSLVETHISETEQQISNLEQVFNILGKQPQRITCDAAAGVISDGQKFMLLAADSQKVLEQGIVGGQLTVEHLEIACYRSLIKCAEQMEQKQVVQLLQQNLQQEEQTAQKLEQLMPQLLQETKSGDSKTTAKSR
ncbi:YciE/YciF ferroxidase family protein [Anabaena sp. WFMT]|uniref:YciE/YciF ferroxidase family protein n=1 Tax=Anabaena sp. WFMT TaxID=3449730 RepID=UPI003F256700